MRGRQLAAVNTLLLIVVGVASLVVGAFSAFPHGLIAVTLVLLGLELAWQGIRRVGLARGALLVLAAVSLAGAIADMLIGQLIVDLIFVGGCIAGAYVFASQVFRHRLQLHAAPRPKRAVVFWNPKSGGGKALAANLADEARGRGITPIELKLGDDLEQLARQAVADGADALAAAGGDGTQAIIAAVAAENDLPFACIPAGTRNHFALDLGVDRDDVVGALDAFVDGGERRVDLADVNGQVFVNNVSIGLYAEAVQRKGYRDAKLRTILLTAPDVVGVDAPARGLTWSGPGGTPHSGAAVILVSNNTYRLGPRLGAGTRPRIDDGELGVTVLAGPNDPAGGGGLLRRPWRQWAATTFEVRADSPVPIGVDGEAAVLEPPLRFAIRPGVLRVRIAPQHPGVSPSAAQPDGLAEGLSMLVRIAAGTDPADVFARR